MLVAGLVAVSHGSLSTSQKQQMLDSHNAYRSQVALGTTGASGLPTAANMNQLVWDSGVASVAQAYVDGCVYGHNGNRKAQVNAASTSFTKDSVCALQWSTLTMDLFVSAS